MPFALIFALLLPADAGHDADPAYLAATRDGLAVGETTAKLPPPSFPDGQSADEQAEALAQVAGSRRAADEMLADSPSAPHRLKLRDIKAEGATIRSGDLVFLLRGVDLDAIDVDDSFRQAKAHPVEAGNMRFEARVLTAQELKAAGAEAPEGREWFVHSSGRLLDRIAVESTDRVVASKTADSLVFASRTDPRFGPDATFPNRWSTVEPKANGDALGPPQPYAGGIGYAKITRWKGLEKAAVVEVHFAFAEPTGWFQGDPILRSKFGLIAQDQVRRLRRELRKKG
jgi:hypothetical protein